LLATIPDGKLPTNQRIEGGEEEEEDLTIFANKHLRVYE